MGARRPGRESGGGSTGCAGAFAPVPSVSRRRAEADTNSLARARSNMCPPGGKAHALSLPSDASSPRLARLTATRLPPRPQPPGASLGGKRQEGLRAGWWTGRSVSFGGTPTARSITLPLSANAPNLPTNDIAASPPSNATPIFFSHREANRVAEAGAGAGWR